MSAPVMIMVAPNGAYAGKTDNPATPISPTEIAEEVIRCAAAGASIAHLHARDAAGKPTQSLAVFREIVEHPAAFVELQSPLLVFRRQRGDAHRDGLGNIHLGERLGQCVEGSHRPLVAARVVSALDLGHHLLGA